MGGAAGAAGPPAEEATLRAWLAAALLLLGGCVHPPSTGAIPPSIIRARASDGWSLALHRYPIPDGVPRHPLPLLLCHGLASNHHSLDLEEGGSLARYLASKGFDVWAVDLRHHGDSRQRPDGGEKVARISFDDYVRLDAPALVAAILAQTHAPSLVWVGHSMGGMIGYGYLGRSGEGVSALVTLASPAAVREEGWVSLGGDLAWFSLVFPASPLRPWAQLHASLCGGWVEWYSDNLVYNRNNLSAGERQLLMGTGVENVTRAEVSQFRGWMKHDDFRSRDGADDYAANLERITVPALLVSGTADHIVPAPNVQFVMQRLGSADKTHRLFGRSEGDPHDWGHVDLVAGELAEKEVFPEVAAWLARHD